MKLFSLARGNPVDWWDSKTGTLTVQNEQFVLMTKDARPTWESYFTKKLSAEMAQIKLEIISNNFYERIENVESSYTVTWKKDNRFETHICQVFL